MMQIMKDIGGVEVPEYLASLAPENGVVPGTMAAAPGANGANGAGAGTTPPTAPPADSPAVAAVDPLPRKLK